MDDCDPQDVAIKSFFLGPQAENGDWLREKWIGVLDHWLSWRRNLFPQDGNAVSAEDRDSKSFIAAQDRLSGALDQILRDLENETPKFTPRYLGHMVSEVSLPAMLGHVCALLHNPNNTSREVSRVTSRLEDEAIADLSRMLNLPNSARGHFTSGGTLANFEALWRAIVHLDQNLEKSGAGSFLSLGPFEFARRYRAKTGRDFGGPVLLVPGNKHFSWEKAVAVMGLGDSAFWSVRLDEAGRMDPADLVEKIDRARKEERPILACVSVAGTTELGQVDPIDRIQDLLDSYRSKHGITIWHHVDAAYGGYFACLANAEISHGLLREETRAAIAAISRVNSVTLDPHKLGYVPYACGAFIARDETHYRTRATHAPYLLAGNDSRWAWTLEGSRSGAGAAATWISNRALGLNYTGYGRLLEKGIQARVKAIAELRHRISHLILVEPSDLNVVCFSLGRAGERLSVINRRALSVFQAFEQSVNFSLSKTVLTRSAYGPLMDHLVARYSIVQDSDEWLMLRLVLMNPFVISKESDTDFLKEFISELQEHDANFKD